MKQTFGALALAFLLMFSIIPGMAFAEEETVPEQENKDIAPMDTSFGAQMRVLQMERAISRSIIHGSVIIDRINELDADKDVSELENILDELELLLEEIENVDVEQDRETVIEQFLAIKTDAKELVKEFRETARALLSEEEAEQIREGLREEVSELVDEELSDLKEEIEELRREHNSERLANHLERLGQDNPELVEQVRNGEISHKELRTQVREIVQGLSPEERKEAAQKLREDRAKRNVEHKGISARFAAQKADRMSDRADARGDRLSLRSDRAEDNGFEWRAKRLDRARSIADRRSDRLDMRADNIRDSMKQRMPPEIQSVEVTQ